MPTLPSFLSNNPTMIRTSPTVAAAVSRSAALRSADRSVARSSRRLGFTLLELLLVLAILVVLGGIVLVNFGGAQADANVNATLTQLNSLKQAVQLYQIRMNSLPKGLEELKDGPSDSAKKAKWTAPILTTIPDDAWGNPITYTLKGNSYELRSGGLDGQTNTEDDLVVSSN